MIGRNSAVAAVSKKNMKTTTFWGLTFWLALVSAGVAADGKLAKADSNGSPGDDLFAAPRVWRFQLEVSAESAESLRKDPKRYVKASLKGGDLKLSDIGLRIKGSAPFEGFEKKPSLALKFNEFVKGQEIHGRSRILLSNADKDPSYMCEALGGEIFRSADVPAPKASFALVTVGGKNLGLYVISEAANKDFLTQYFKKTKGNLYEGSNNDISDKLEKDGGDSSTDQADLKAVVAVLKEPDLTERNRRLGPLLDLERFTAFAAVEVLSGHHDGYTMDKNNYRVYNDPATGQLVFLPHGLDQLFSKPDEPLFPEWKGLVAKAVLSTPAGQSRYLDKMSALLAGGAKVEALHRYMDDLAKVIRPALAEADTPGLKAFDDASAKLRENVTRRHAFLTQQLKSQAVSK